MRSIRRPLLLWLKIGRYRQASEQGFSHLAENASLYICRYDRHGRFLYISPNMARALNVGPDELIGTVATAKRYPDDRFDTYHHALQLVLATGEPTELELTVPNAHGNTAIHHVRLVAEHDWLGRLAGALSLSYLTRFPIATLKIDRSFTQPATGYSKSRVLMEAIVAMAHGVGLSVVAEGVETRELADWLAGIGCDMGQGYLWSNAVSAHTLLEMETHARGSLGSCDDDGPVHRSGLGLINERLL